LALNNSIAPETRIGSCWKRARDHRSAKQVATGARACGPFSADDGQD